MKERPILFSGPMVQAILEGRKTQTRRVVKLRDGSLPDESSVATWEDGSFDKFMDFSQSSPYWEPVECPYGVPGDRLWVQENYRLKLSDERWVNYPASGDAWQRWTNPTEAELEKLSKRTRHVGLNTPGRFMYRSLSRITLEIVSVRVERLQDITDADAIAEGCEMGDDGFPVLQPNPSGGHDGWDSAPDWYAWLWESINGAGSWDVNPWVWALEFRRVESAVVS